MLDHSLEGTICVECRERLDENTKSQNKEHANNKSNHSVQ